MRNYENETRYKYEANLHIDANKESVKFIGNVQANSLKELKELAREKARNWNNYGRIHVQTQEREFFINA